MALSLSSRLLTAVVLGAVVSTSIGAQGFIDTTAAANLMIPTQRLAFGTGARGVAAEDFDGDGDIDLIVPGLDAEPIQYFENDGTATFTERTVASGLPQSLDTISMAAADIDNDGDKDLFIGSATNNDRFFLNDGNGVFTDVSTQMGVSSPVFTYGATFGDFDRDGWLDVLVVVWHPVEVNRFYRNIGGQGFQRMPASAGLDEVSTTLAAAWMDYNDDGWPDLYTANDKGHALLPNSMYENNGDGTFTDVSVATNTHEPMFAMGLDFADAFNDGGLDFFVTDGPDFHLFAVWDPVSQTYFHGEHVFGMQGGTDGWCVEFCDFNNDGWQDLNVTHEDFQSPLFMNPGMPFAAAIPWTNVQPTLAPQMINRNQSCMVVADFNNDGRDDILNIYRDGPRPDQALQLLMSNVPGGNWLRFDPEGVRSNREGFGAKIQVTTGSVTQTQWARSGVGFSSTTDQRVHFGVGPVASVDRVDVRWPSGQLQVLTDVAINQTMVLREPDYHLEGSSQIGTTSQLELDSMGDAGLPYLMPISGTAGSMALPSGRLIPIQFDALTAPLIALGNGVVPNAVGLLDADGRASTDLVIPNSTGLVGLTLHATAITIDLDEPDGVRTILPAVEVAIF